MVALRLLEVTTRCHRHDLITRSCCRCKMHLLWLGCDGRCSLLLWLLCSSLLWLNPVTWASNRWWWLASLLFFSNDYAWFFPFLGGMNGKFFGRSPSNCPIIFGPTFVSRQYFPPVTIILSCCLVWPMWLVMMALIRRPGRSVGWWRTWVRWGSRSVRRPCVALVRGSIGSWRSRVTIAALPCLTCRSSPLSFFRRCQCPGPGTRSILNLSFRLVVALFCFRWTALNIFVLLNFVIVSFLFWHFLDLW